MPSWKKPTDEQIERAMSLIARPEFARDFFERLENPEWVEALLARGYFEHPPGRVVEDEGRTIALPRWPISRYLARVAGVAPEYAVAIHRALLSIPDTDNDAVHEDIIVAATRLPAKLAAEVAGREARWIRGRDQLFGLVADRVPDLVKQLLTGGQTKAALGLMRSILLLDAKTLAEDVVGKIDTYEYESIIEETLLALVTADPLESIRLFSSLLSFALDKKRSVDTAPHDYSYIWHAHIDRDDNPGDSIEGTLTTAVRDAAQETIRLKPILLLEVLALLFNQRWLIFRRIALFLLAGNWKVAPEQARDEALSRSNFDEYVVRREYDALLHEVLCELPEADREIYFDWVTKGPDLAGNRFIGDEAAYALSWKRDRLRPVSRCIPNDLRPIAEDLPPFDLDEEEEVARITRSWIDSPFTAGDLEALPVDQVIARLATWEPTPHDLTARIEFGRELRKAVAARANEFLAAADEFKALHPTYVRSLIEGLDESVRGGTPIDWSSMLRFCRWAVMETRTVDSPDQGVTDTDFSWTRGAIVRLLQTTFHAPETSRLPVGYAGDAWDIIRPVTDDPDPLRDASLPINTDPATQALNCNRGQALHATVAYLLWLRAATDTATFRRHPSIPSVEQVLTDHLTESEAPAILSIYGQYFPWLLKALPEWTHAQRDNIFPVDNERVWTSTWPAYLAFCAAYNDVFRTIEDKYLHAAANASRSYPEWNSQGKPARKFVEHIAVLFGRGVVKDDGELFRQTLSSATPELRAHMVWFVNNLLNTDESWTDRSSIGRFQALWDAHISRPAERSGQVEELRAFGWYSLSDAIPAQWFLERLITVLRTARAIRGTHWVMARLAANAKLHADLAVQALALLLQTSTDDAGVDGARNEMKAVLERGMASQDEGTRRKATDVVNALGRMGFKEYRSLLDK